MDPVFLTFGKFEEGGVGFLETNESGWGVPLWEPFPQFNHRRGGGGFSFEHLRQNEQKYWGSYLSWLIMWRLCLLFNTSFSESFHNRTHLESFIRLRHVWNVWCVMVCWVLHMFTSLSHICVVLVLVDTLDIIDRLSSVCLLLTVHCFTEMYVYVLMYNFFTH